MGGSEWVYLGAGLLFPIAAVLLVVAFVVSRRRRRHGDGHVSSGRGPGDVATTPRLVGGDRLAVRTASNETEAAVIAAALAGEGVEATVRSTGAAGYGAREFSVLVPVEDRDRAEALLSELDASGGRDELPGN